ncbi:hypothetical protein Tco_1167711, partial [Tanacetum coccineum]
MHVKECHSTVVKTILKYLRNTKDVFLVYGGNLEKELRVTYRKSAKQSTIAITSTKAEFIAASEAAMEVVWMRKIIDGLEVIPTH